MRALTCTSGVLALVLASWAQALGLGEIYLHSALNEPLRAEISLVGVERLDEAQILARLASAADFEQAGIERSFELQDLHFVTDFANSAAPLVRVTSQSAVREPYLNFLLELRWPSGRLLREYTLLLDPPGMGVLASDVAPRRAPVAVEREDDVAGDIVAGSGSHWVVSGQTLWQIATRYAPSGMSIHAMAAAIHRLNPDAFRGGDINRLLAGATLRLPTTARPAQGGDARQHAAALRSATASDTAPAPVDRDPAALGDTASIASEAPSVAEQLAAALAQVERLKIQNNELRSKIEQLEAIANGAPPTPQLAPVGTATDAQVATSSLTRGSGEPQSPVAGTELAPSANAVPVVATATATATAAADAQAATATSMAAVDTGELAPSVPDAIAEVPAPVAANAADAPPSAGFTPPATSQRAADIAGPASTPVAALPSATESWLSVVLAPYVPVVGILAAAMLVLVFLLLRKRSQARLDGDAGVYGVALGPGSGRIVPTLPMAVEAVHIDDEIAPEPEPPPLRATDYLRANTPAADAAVAPVGVDPAAAADADTVELSLLDEFADEAVEPADLGHWDENPKGGARNDLSATQLELAQAYLDIEDPDGAREILAQVIATGNVDQQAKARALLDGLGRDVVH